MNKITAKLAAISLLHMIAATTLFPLIAPHIRSLGASHFVLGFIGATFAGLQVLSGPVIGSWSDIRGRKFTASITLCISAVCCCLMGLTSSIQLIFLMQLILGMVEHTQILSKAITGDLLPKEELTKAYGQIGAVTCLGVIVGPIAGGHMIEVENGFFHVCILTTLLHVFNIGLIQSVELKQPTKQAGFSYLVFKTEISKIIKDLAAVDWNSYWEVFTLRFLFSFLVMLYFNSQAVYIAEKYELTQKSIGYIIALFGVLGIVSVVSIGHIKTKFYKNDDNNSKLMLHLYTVMTISLLGLYCAPDYVTFLLATVPFGFTNSGLSIITMEVILNKSTNSDRGVLTGASESVMGIGRFFAPLISGIMADLFGGSVVLLVAFICSLLGSLLCFKILKYSKDIKKSD